MPRNCLCLPTSSFPRGPTFYYTTFLQLSGRRMKKHRCFGSAEPKRLGIRFSKPHPQSSPGSGCSEELRTDYSVQQGTLRVKDFVLPNFVSPCPYFLSYSEQNPLPFDSDPVCANVLTPQTCSKINPRKLPDVLFVLWCFSVLVSRD